MAETTKANEMTKEPQTSSGEREKVILAYSGGLDTSVLIKWLTIEKNFDVICVSGDLGQDQDDMQQLKDKALKCGAVDCLVVDMREDYANEYLSKALVTNALYEDKYPLLSALSRPLIAKHLVNAAHAYGAKYVAHGCTGKGNDQVRLDTSVMMLDPSLTVLAPVREWDLQTRPEEMDWAEAHGVDIPVTRDKPYSIDDNIWGRAIECGVLENPWNEPTPDIWTTTVDPKDAPDEFTYLELTFKEGLPVAIDGKPMSFLDIIYKMNEVAGANGFGRLDLIENRLVGVKSRECYECPGSMSLIKAHQALEDLVLERDLLRYKFGIEQTWAVCVYNGQWFAPLKQALDAFVKETQRCVTGEVRLRFYKGNCDVVGVKSPYSLYDYGLATYDAGDTFDRHASEGFIELFSLPLRVWAENRHDMDALGEQWAEVEETKHEFDD